MNIEEIKTSLEPLILSAGFTLVSLKLSSKKDGLVLEVVVDRVKPIDLDAISLVSGIISKKLDELDPIDSDYTLDVSSLGAEKPLEVSNLRDYVGEYLNIHLSNPYKGLNILEGILDDVSDDFATLSYKEKTRLIKVKVKTSEIDKARLAIKF